jgi:hypothetical protein
MAPQAPESSVKRARHRRGPNGQQSQVNAAADVVSGSGALRVSPSSVSTGKPSRIQYSIPPSISLSGARPISSERRSSSERLRARDLTLVAHWHARPAGELDDLSGEFGARIGQRHNRGVGLHPVVGELVERLPPLGLVRGSQSGSEETTWTLACVASAAGAGRGIPQRRRSHRTRSSRISSQCSGGRFGRRTPERPTAAERARGRSARGLVEFAAATRWPLGYGRLGELGSNPWAVHDLCIFFRLGLIALLALWDELISAVPARLWSDDFRPPSPADAPIRTRSRKERFRV